MEVTMSKFETFLEELADKKAEQRARMSNAYERNKKLIKLRKIPHEVRLKRKYEKWAKLNDVFIEEEVKSLTLQNVWTNLVDNFN